MEEKSLHLLMVRRHLKFLFVSAGSSYIAVVALMVATVDTLNSKKTYVY